MTQVIPTTFALDYDGTITNDPETFKSIVATLRSAGHEVYIVTMRHESEVNQIEDGQPSIVDQWSTLVNGIIATGRHGKKQFTDKLGIKIDVWIDDSPRSVLTNCTLTYGHTTPEGVTVVTGPHVQYKLFIRGIRYEPTEDFAVIMRDFVNERSEHLHALMKVFYRQGDSVLAKWTIGQLPDQIINDYTSAIPTATLLRFLRQVRFTYAEIDKIYRTPAKIKYAQEMWQQMEENGWADECCTL